METLNLSDICKNAVSIGITGHIRPDGDCVGSCLGLYRYLSLSFPAAHVRVFLEKPADTFAKLPGYEEICSGPPVGEDVSREENSTGESLLPGTFDVFFVLDCGADRVGGAGRYVEEARLTVNIDHHISNTGTCMLNYIVPTASSTSELIYDLTHDTYMDKELAQLLYLGIIHDTGVFQYSNTSPETMRKAGELIGYGFDFPRMIEETFYQKTYMQNQLLGRAVLESIRFMDGRCIVSRIDKKTMDFYGAGPSDMEGIVNQLRNTKGVDCAIFMYQTGDLEYKVSLRTTEAVDAAKAAGFFGGGGHMRAAGCSMKGTFHDCVNNLAVQIERQLKG